MAHMMASAVNRPVASTAQFFRVFGQTGPSGERSIGAGWLGDLDSNQDCSGQSREFYR